MVDTGADTKVIKPGVLLYFKPQKLQKSVWFRTLNGLNEITEYIRTPMPKQFVAIGNISWKVLDFQSKNYDAIIGQNFLVPFKAQKNLEHKYIELFGNWIFFEEQKCPFKSEEICTLEEIEYTFTHIRDNIDLSHLNPEEQSSIKKLM